jgi:hypothetical protein
MRLKYDENAGELVIKLKEERAVYCDEEQLLYFLSSFNWVEPYYSEKGELVELHWGVGAGHLIEWKEAEAIISDTLPWRKYVFTFGKENEIPKICADDIYKVPEIGNRFSESGRLIIQRRDGNEMGYHEIKGLREALFECILKFSDAMAFLDWNIDSVYKGGKLYFWAINESFYPKSEKEFIENMEEMLKELIGYGICDWFEYGNIEIKERELGFDIITRDEDCELMTIVCIHDYDEEAMVGELNKEELINICENTVEYMGEKIKRRRIVLLGLELSKEAKEWARSHGIKVQSISEFIAEYDIYLGEFNDELVEPHAEEWEKDITKRFVSS